MKFIVSSGELLNKLQILSKVIENKNIVSSLDCFLFEINKNKLFITAADLENRIVTNLEVETNNTENFSISINSKLLIKTLSNFDNIPLIINIDTNTLEINIQTENGLFSMVGENSENYPAISNLINSINVFILNEILYNGINKTLFATANDELRPTINGIFFNIENDKLSFVSTDTYKLIIYTRHDFQTDNECSFILKKKISNILLTILQKVKTNFEIEYYKQENKIVFKTNEFVIYSNLEEGYYVPYKSVIPENTQKKAIINRIDLLTALKRVAIFSNDISKLIKLSFTTNQLSISAQNIDFSVSAYELINCNYKFEDFTIGFRSEHIKIILEKLNSENIEFNFNLCTSASLLYPDKHNENENEVILLMPMNISD